MASAAAHTEDLIRRMTPISTPPAQQASVEALSKLLAAKAQARKHKGHACIVVEKDSEPTPIPDSVFHLLERIVEVLARGDAVTVVPVGKELTTQQAADLLNISRQFLVRLLDEGKLPHCKTGRHRRLKIEDVLAYKEKRSKERKASLRKLTAMTQEFGGYDREDD